MLGGGLPGALGALLAAAGELFITIGGGFGEASVLDRFRLRLTIGTKFGSRSLRGWIGELEKDFPRVKESLLSAMGNLQTGRLLDPRYLDLEGGLEGSGDEPEAEPLTVLQ